MNRKELAEVVAREAGLTPVEADAAIGAAFAGVIAAVAKEEKVVLAGFGTFEARHRAARAGRNPQTGEPMEIAASVTPAFKPAAAFKQAVSGA